MPENSTAATKAKSFLLSKYYILISLFMLIVGIALQTYNTTTTLYVEYLGGSPDKAGLMLTSFTVAATLMRFAGNLVDRFGRIKVIFIGSIIFAVGAIGFCLPFVNLLYVFRFIQGIGYSLTTTAIGVAIADVIPQPRMNEGIGYYGLAQTLPTAIAPAVALALCDQGEGPFNGVFIFAAAIMLLVAVGILFSRYDKDEKFLAKKAAAEEGFVPVKAVEELKAPKEKGIWAIFDKTALLVVLPMLALTITVSSTAAFLTLFAKDAGIENISLYYTVNVVVTVVARLALSKAMNKMPLLACVLPGFALIAISFCMLLLSTELPLLFYISGGLNGVGMCLINPPITAEVVRRAAPHRRGVAMSTYFVISDIGFGIGAYLWGLLLDLTQKNYTLLFILCMVGSMIGLLSAVVLLRPKKKSVIS